MCAPQVMQFDVSNDVVRKQITAELRTLYDSHHTFIVRYYQVQCHQGSRRDVSLRNLC